MTELPPKLKEVLEDFAFVDRNERWELLIEAADRFEAVAPRIAERPFSEANHVQKCESDAYVFAEDLPDGTVKFHFAVENPQGLSAKAWAVLLDDTLSGQPLEQVAAVPCDVVFTVYGKDLSMGKGQGLMGITDMVTYAARKRLNERKAAGMAS